MMLKLFVLLFAVWQVHEVLGKTRRFSRSQTTNSLSRARCDLICLEKTKEGKTETQQCRSKCRSQEQKPGTCPIQDSPKWAAACIESCNSDSQCDATQRCCRHDCGASCSEPIDLLTIPGLPAMPIVEEPREKRRGKVQIRWSGGVGDIARAVPGRVLYILEEQHHLGPKFEEDRLGDWNMLLRTNKTKISLRDVLKPGRWYRFRVASVGTSGSRGFSNPSAPFTPRRGPRPPPKPKKLKVRPVRVENDSRSIPIRSVIPTHQQTGAIVSTGTVTVRLEWKEPQSDLPVLRYKVYWSRRARGIGGELDSVLVNHQNVPKNQNYIEIKDLQRNSMYFLQVQTISQFGVGKLRSDKAEIFYNTTSTVKDAPAENLRKREIKIKGLKLNKIIWNNHKLKARVSWDPLPQVYEEPGRYYVQWKTLKCENPKQQHKTLSATTEQTNFEIYELEYHCTYSVNVNKSLKPRSPDSELLIKVPGCEYFQKRVNNGTMLDC